MVTINSSGDTQRRAPPPGLLRLRHRKCFPKSSSGGRSDNRGQGVSVTGCTFGLRPAVKASPFGVDLLLNQVLRCAARADWPRSEEHTSELQSRGHLVCRLLLEKKKKQQISNTEL